MFAVDELGALGVAQGRVLWLGFLIACNATFFFPALRVILERMHQSCVKSRHVSLYIPMSGTYFANYLSGNEKRFKRGTANLI